MARADFSYSNSRQRKKGHFKLFSDDLPPITFNSALLQHSIADRRTKDRKEADIYSLPPIDRREADLLSVSDHPRAKSQSPLTSSNASRRGRQRTRQSGLLQRKDEDLILPDLPTPPENRRQRRVSPESGANRHYRRTNWGYIRPDKDTTSLKNAAAREHDLYKIYTRKKPTAYEVKARPRTFDGSQPVAVVRSPKIRTNEQVTILIHNQSDTDQEVISITHSLQSGSKLLRRRHRIEESVQNPGSMDETKESTHDTYATMSQETQGQQAALGKHRGDQESSGLQEYETYLSRLNESLNDCHRHGNPPKERKRRPKQGSGNSSLSSAKVLPPINETNTEDPDARRQTVSQPESRKRVTVEDPNTQHLRMPWFRKKANEDMLKSQQRKAGHDNFNTDPNHVPPAPKSVGKKSKKRRRQRRTSPSQAASDKESNSTGELLERSELDPTEYLLQHVAEEDIDRSMSGVELLKFYRIWDRKRKKFPSGLRKITAPDIRKPDETLSSVITFAKSFKALRERKGSQDIAPLVGMAE